MASDRSGGQQAAQGRKGIEGPIRQLQYADEETPSERDYPQAYRPRPVEDQFARLSALFPRLMPGVVSPAALPDGAESWFVIPDWRRVAPSYNAAVSEALAIVARTRAVSLSRADRLGPGQLRQHERSSAMAAKLTPTGNGDFLLVAAQFGRRHRGRSIRHARELFLPNEFGLGVFAVACLLLTHPERFAQTDQLYVDCAGDEYTASDEPQFSEAPYFRFLDGRLGFGTSWIGYVDPYFGSASAFL